MQSHMSFTHSNNNNNYDNIHINKKFKPAHKAKPKPLTLGHRLAYQAQSKPPNIIKPLLNHVKTFPLTDTPSSNPESRFSPPRSFQFLVRTTQTGFPYFLTSKQIISIPFYCQNLQQTSTQHYSYFSLPIHNQNNPKQPQIITGPLPSSNTSFQTSKMHPTTSKYPSKAVNPVSPQ
ncbi:hypothetical protein GQ457_03G020330 [Hibiscus cannabinus]